MGFVIRFVVRNGLRVCLVWGVSVAFVAHEARMERAKRDVGFVIRCGMVLDFGLVWGVLSAFVALEAQRGVCDLGKWTPALALAPNFTRSVVGREIGWLRHATEDSANY